MLHVDGGREYIPAWINAGSGEGRFDLVFDPGHCRSQPLAIDDDELDGIHLSHVIENVRDAQALFGELYRVAKPGAELVIRVTYGAPDESPASAALRVWTEGSFSHFDQPSQPAGTTYRADWQLESVGIVADAPDTASVAELLHPPSAVHAMIVSLRAVKPARARTGRHLAPRVEPHRCEGRALPDFGIASERAAVDRPPLKLGLPWRLPHYVAMNGPHPVVRCFIDGNAALEPVALEAAASVSGEVLDAVALRAVQAARNIPPEATRGFLRSLNLQDQLAIESQAAKSDALFLHTTPHYAGSKPWIFHFESFPSLFMPFMYTGRTTGIDLRAQGFFALVRETLESPQCRRIFSHMRGSLEILGRTFDSPQITAKCRHVPLGIASRSTDAATAKYARDARLRILFTNSLHQEPSSFYLRGGHHLLTAFAQLRRLVPGIELTILSSVPADLLDRFTPSHLIGVNWIDHRVDDAALEQLYLDHHLFALPAAGLHSFSLLRAMANGCVPIVSDAPGYEEYTGGIEDSVLPIHGVREQVYRDEPSGWTSDLYAPFVADSPAYAAQIHDQVLGHASLAQLRERAVRNLEHCRTRFSVEASQAAFNRMLEEVRESLNG